MKPNEIDMKNWQWLPIDDLVPYEMNAKTHPEEQIRNLMQSLKDYGWTRPITVNADKVIIIGHGILLAAKALGLEKAPVVIRDDLDEQEQRKLRNLDNKLGESPWDLDLLQEDLQGLDLSDYKLDWGVKLTMDKPEEDPADDGYEPKLPEEPSAKQGQIWQLGNHRLMCGDATSVQDVQMLVGGVQMDMYLTDPPYGISYTGGTEDALTIVNDDLDIIELEAFLAHAFKAADKVLKPGGAFYIWHASRTVQEFISGLTEAMLEVRQMLIWVKSQFTLGRQDYQWQHEACLYGWKAGAEHYFTEYRTETTVFSDARQLNLNSLKKDELKELCEKLIAAGETPSTVIFEQKPARNAEHPTMKPVKLFGRLIRNSTRPGEAVLDSFGGSGTTMIACEQLNRRCYMMELDPRYCDVIIDRWEKFTGRKAVLLNAG